MKLTEFLSPSNIRHSVELSSKKRALELIGHLVAEHLNESYQCDEEQAVCPVACFTNLFKREKLGSTGINNGVALPHAKLPENSSIQLEKPIAIFLQLAEPIAYESSDNKEVDLIYALLFPENSCETYKTCLPQIAEKLADKNLLKLLRCAESADDLWQVLVGLDNREEGD